MSSLKFDINLSGVNKKIYVHSGGGAETGRAFQTNGCTKPPQPPPGPAAPSIAKQTLPPTPGLGELKCQMLLDKHEKEKCLKHIRATLHENQQNQFENCKSKLTMIEENIGRILEDIKSLHIMVIQNNLKIKTSLYIFLEGSR